MAPDHSSRERSEAIQENVRRLRLLDRRVAPLLAMTIQSDRIAFGPSRHKKVAVLWKLAQRAAIPLSEILRLTHRTNLTSLVRTAHRNQGRV